MNVIDPACTEVLELGALGRHVGRVTNVDGAADWRQEDDVLIARPSNGHSLATVLRVELEPASRPIAVRETVPPRLLDERLAAAEGEHVALDAGTWTASSFPIHVPAGVVLAGSPGTVIDAGGLGFGTPAVVLDGDGAGVLDLRIRGVADGIMFLSNAAVTATGCAT